MHTYLLIGLAKNGGFIFPKHLCAVRAASLADAAARLGGRLHDVGKNDRQPFEAIFMPDVECAVFHGGTDVGAKIGEAVFGALDGELAPDDADALRRGSQGMLGMFAKLLLGRVPTIG